MASAHGSGPEVVTAVAQLLYTHSSLLWGFLRPHNHSETLGSYQGAMGLSSGSGPAAVGFGWPNVRKELHGAGRGLKGREGNPETESARSSGDMRLPGPLDGGSGVHGHTSSSERALRSQG